MQAQVLQPVGTDIVLVGAGHANVQVLRFFGMNPVPGVRITIITDRLLAPYSGMLPGCIAGDYTSDEIHIDVGKLARDTGARLIHAAAVGLDRSKKQLLLKGRPPVAYDLLALNVGITPDLTEIAGAAERAVPVKPIAGLLGRLERAVSAVRQLPRPAKLAVIGGGAAGIELALALYDRNRKLTTIPSEITLVAGGGLAASLNAGMKRRAATALARAGIAVVEGDRAIAVEPGAVVCQSGRRIPNDVAFVSTNARLPQWLAATDIPKAANGGLAIRQTLQLQDDDAVFAAGDCASITGFPRVRAGVFAVRQGPWLARNLMAAARGERLASYTPQKDYLTILRTAADSAIAGRGRFFAMEGKWIARWKDRIDRRFMEMFAVEGKAPDADDGMRCGGCAAKVGPDPLAAALSRLSSGVGSERRMSGFEGADDAAVINWPGGTPVVTSVDQFRSFLSDPWLFGRIAANHALNDLYAMGAVPHHALALATLPFGKASKVSEDLFQMLAGAQATLDEAGVPLVGGHSSEGEGLALGFSVTGHPKTRLLAKRGAEVGDCLVLTKPLGSGIVFAADMRAAAPAATVEAMLTTMVLSNRAAADVLVQHGATSATDITGFGLLGHLAEMLDAGRGASLDVGAVPLVQGVLALASKGYVSSLLPENLTLLRHVKDAHQLDASWRAVLFDPQTAGGLLASIPPSELKACLAALHNAGYREAAVVGTITAGTGQITLAVP
ncbi:MAG: selenide, water dikinase SelD [Beijerinckiaceae bacterium]